MQNFFLKSKSFGIVMHMEKDSEEEHIPLTKKEAMLCLLNEFYNLGVKNNEVEEYVIGHEHGEKNNGCHYQIYIKFTYQVRKCIKPSKFVKNNITILYMAQKTKTPAKLRNYCKKDHDYIEEFPCKSIKDILKENNLIEESMDIDDPYDYLFKTENLNEKQIINVFKNCDITEFKKNFLIHSKNILETYNSFIKKDDSIPEFSWKFPKHILEYLEDNSKLLADKKIQAYSKIYEWFLNYCEPEGEFRRKSLFLFSISGGLGKSFFARSLVPEISLCNSPYYVYCRGTLDAAEFSSKKETARLVILDDVNYIDKDMEIWKALTVSEPTNIRTPYHNINWNKSLPCILLSNNIKTLKYWTETPDLQTRCIFVGIDFYIGPPGTDNEVYHEVNSYFTDDIEKSLNKGVFSKLFN